MKRALFCTLCLVCALPAYSETTYAPAVNVGYVSQRLSQRYANSFGQSLNITNNASASQIANMKYLLGTIDKINQKNKKTTNYADTALATTQVINTAIVDKAFDALVSSPHFALTVNGTNRYGFRIRAAGNFYVDCGNGGTLTHNDTTYEQQSLGILVNNKETTSTFTCQ